MPQNMVNAAMDEKVKDQVITKIREVNDLMSFTVNLSNDDKQGIVLMGDKSIAFVEKALEMAKIKRELLPQYLNLEEMELDFKLAKDLAVIIFEMESVLEKVKNTHLAAGSDAFVAALSFYNAAKAANKSGVPGLNSMIEELSQRFPGKKGSKLPGHATKDADITA